LFAPALRVTASPTHPEESYNAVSDMAERSSAAGRIIAVIIGVGVVIYILSKMFQQSSAPPAPQAQLAPDYRQTPICDTGDETENDHSRDKDISEFRVVLKEHCFSLGFVKPPRTWGSWRIQFVNPDRSRDYVGFWFYGSQNPEGPWKPGDIPELPYRFAAWRVQGHGTVRFIKTG
jgi:hypothetical protein